jgi:hypothetical protein
MARQRYYDPEIHTTPGKPLEELKHTDHAAFTAEVKALVRDAENTRLRFMQKRQRRGFITLTIGLISSLAGASAFGWFFLVNGDLARGIGYLCLSLLPPLLLYTWADAPIRKYTRAHKTQFMPRLAKTLGGFKYSARGGVSSKILKQTGIAPPHDRYTHEDCFTGIYKGIKVIMSEARLYKGSKPVFQGMFVLLETAKPICEAYLILTADKKMAQDYAGQRWQTLQTMPITSSNPDWNRFVAFTDKPEEAAKIINDKLLKELSEAADVFNRCPISAAFLKGRFIFLSIPCREDLFEASEVHVPIPTSEHAEERRKEIEKLLEVIDVFDIYGKETAKSAREG